MTVLERLKAAGYDPAKAITHYLTAGTGEMECARIAINTFRTLERNILVVAATAFTVLPDGSYGLYPEYWPHYLEASARLYFPLDAEFGNYEIDPQNRSEHDRYVLLDRLLSDCRYFLGAGHRNRQCGACGRASLRTTSPHGLRWRKSTSMLRKCSSARFTDRRKRPCSTLPMMRSCGMRMRF